MKTKHSDVSIVIPSYNCKKILFRLLNSIRKSNYPNFEVIVVDNGSKDKTLEEGRRKYRWVRWIDAGEENIGQTGTYNLGFAHTNPKSHIMMIDSDVIVEYDMIKKLVERLESDKRIGIVTPMILYLSDKNWVNQAGANVELWTGKVNVGWGPKKNFLKAKKVQNSGTVMLFSRDVVSKIGVFEDWFLCYFDPDYCLRAKKEGFDVWYEPKAVCYHDQSKEKEIWGPRILSRAYLLGRNRTLFMRKHGKSIILYILFTPLIWAYYLKESLKYGIFPKWLQLVKGTIAGFFYPLAKGNKIPLPRV